jgi:hypothetical protein
MALEFFLYRTDIGNTVIDRNLTGFTTGVNEAQIQLDTNIPTTQSLFLYREQGGALVENLQSNIDELFNEQTGGVIQPDEAVEQQEFTGFTASTQTEIDNINQTINELPTGLTAVQVRRTTTLALGAAFVDVTFDTVDLESDPTTLSASTTNTDRIDVGENGLYQITYSLIGDDGVEGRVRVNDSTVVAGSTKNTNATIGGFATLAINQAVSVNVITQLSAGDFLTLQAQQAGSTLLADAVFTVTKLDSARGRQGEKGDQGEPGTGVEINVRENGSLLGNSPFSDLNFSGFTIIEESGNQVLIAIPPTTGSTGSPTDGIIQLIDGAGGQELDNISPVALTWDTQDFIDTTIYSHTLSSGIITINETGTYEISYNVNGDNQSNARSTTGVQVRINGSTLLAATLTANYSRNNSNDDNNNALPPFIVSLNATDTVEIVGFRLGDANSVLTKAGASFVRINKL